VGGLARRRKTVHVIRRIQIGVAALAVGMTLTAAAEAGANTPERRALEIRSQAMNDKYNLDALNALQIRSDALNRRYQLGVYAKPAQAGNEAALRALGMRGRAMNVHYRLGSYAIVRQPSKGFDWADATIGGAVVFGLVLIGGAVAVGTRRFRGERLTPA
jgi:hypothetical protein